MTDPLVSVILETVTAQSSVSGGRLVDRLAGPLTALARQTYPQDRIEPIIVVGEEVPADEREEIARRYPAAAVTGAAANNYFDAKNRGTVVARGEIVTFLDGDCTPEPEWLEALVARFDARTDVVAGCVRYDSRKIIGRALSVPDFGYILADESGEASGLNLGNVAFRRDVLLANPLDARLVRNGACYNLFHQLKAQHARIVYEPTARVSHGMDFAGLGFLAKHYKRGYDGLEVYRLDQQALFRGTAYYHRFGGLALVALSGRRVLVDWARLLRHRRQIGISTAALPAYAVLGAILRFVELVGSLVANGARRSRPVVSERGETTGKLS